MFKPNIPTNIFIKVCTEQITKDNHSNRKFYDIEGYPI